MTSGFQRVVLCCSSSLFSCRQLQQVSLQQLVTWQQSSGSSRLLLLLQQ